MKTQPLTACKHPFNLTIDTKKFISGPFSMAFIVSKSILNAGSGIEIGFLPSVNK